MIPGFDKNAFRDLIAAGTEAKLQSDPCAVITYAAAPQPEKQRYRKRPTASDLQFKREIEKLREETGDSSERKDLYPDDQALSLDDFPGLLVGARKFRR